MKARVNYVDMDSHNHNYIDGMKEMRSPFQKEAKRTRQKEIEAEQGDEEETMGWGGFTTESSMKTHCNEGQPRYQ